MPHYFFIRHQHMLFPLKIRWYILIYTCICIVFNVSGQRSKAFNAHITTWYQNRQGAVSISFDDGGYSQYVSAYPILEKYNIKATFGIVGEWIQEEPAYSSEPDHFDIKRMGWEQVLELCDHGHEIAAHGSVHERYDKNEAIPELAVKMEKIKSLIESRTSTTVYTIIYPYSYASANIPKAAREAGFLFGRTGLDTVNPSSPPDMYLLASCGILNETIPDSAEFKEWLYQAKGNWLILMYHHLYPAGSKEYLLIDQHTVRYSYSLTPEEFELQVKRLNESEYWIAPIQAVGKYTLERDNSIVLLSRDKNQITVGTISDLNSEIYNQPLTLEVKVPWKRVSIKGSLNDGVLETKKYKLLIDVLPGKLVTISRERK